MNEFADSSAQPARKPLPKRADRHSAIANRAIDLMIDDSAISGSTVQMDKHVRTALADYDLPEQQPTPLAVRIIAWAIALILLSAAVPGLGWVIGYVILPMWHRAFGWL